MGEPGCEHLQVERSAETPRRGVALCPLNPEVDSVVEDHGPRKETAGLAHTSRVSEMTPNSDTAADKSQPPSALAICSEFLKVLGRTEVEQPIICQRVCACQQFWRYQHYLLPLWAWGVRRMVCFGLGSFKNVRAGCDEAVTCPPLLQSGPGGLQRAVGYRDVIRNETLVKAFNAGAVDRHDALQAMLRHVAAVDMASGMKFCSSRRGVEHQLVKHHFKKLTLAQDLLLGGDDGRAAQKLSKMPPTAGYAGDDDLVDIPIYLFDPEYTAEDREALDRLSDVFEKAHLPPIKVVDGALEGACLLADEHTLVYAVDPDFPVRSKLLGSGCRPAAMIWRDHAVTLESGDVLPDRFHHCLDKYEEFKLDRREAPHTTGSSHLYIRRDVVENTEKQGIVPPYPVAFPHGYPCNHRDQYLGKMEKRGMRQVVRNVRSRLSFVKL